MENKFNISFKAIYKQIGPNLKYGAYIRKKIEGDNEYYDLLEAPPECGESNLIAHDGERCTLLRAIDDQILLKSDDHEQTMCLTTHEFEIGSFLCSEAEMLTEKAMAFCQEIALHFAYTLTTMHANRIILDNCNVAKLYDSPQSLLIDYEEKLIDDYIMRGTDWNDVVEFINKSIKKETRKGIRHAHIGDVHYWSASYLGNNLNIWLGRYNCIIDAIIAKRKFTEKIESLDLATSKGMNKASEIANNMIEQTFSDHTAKMTPEMIASMLLSTTCLSPEEIKICCKTAAELLLSQQETIQTFIDAVELLKQNPSYKKYVDNWRRENHKDKLSYPSGDQVYRDWALLKQLVSAKGKG